MLNFLRAVKNRIIKEKDYLTAQFTWKKLQKEFSAHYSVLSPKETVKHVLNNHCSIARFGDGEFSIIQRKEGPKFQGSSSQLATRLSDVFDKDANNLLICIPRFFVSSVGYNKRGKDYAAGYVMKEQGAVLDLLKSRLPDNYVFGDAYVSRPYTAYKPGNANKMFPLLKQLWNNKDILIVEGEKTRIGVGNDLISNAKSIKRIIAPAEDAFSVYANILKKIVENWKGELVLLALGPTATVLAYDCSKLGIQALDLGHVDIQYEWYLSGSPWNPISGKYTNEAIGGREVADCHDERYLSQIICSISGKD